jgi:5-formyltetrahydrofolate cyclo-ligase
MKSWRQNQRRRLIEERSALSSDEHRQIAEHCLAHIADYLAQCDPGVIGLYWPIKGELDCRPLAESLLQAGWLLSVPVINNETRKLAFARWQPDTAMTTGVWNIPVPVSPEWLSPTRFLVPLVGFDKANYRLGYGGGYYDRTLADMSGKIEAIGVGMEMGRFETIHPHALDVPMNRIITETGMQMPEPQNAPVL